MSVFGKAKSKVVEKPVTKKGTSWVVSSEQDVSAAVTTLVQLEAESKAIEAKMGLAKTLVKKYAGDKFIAQFATEGVKPATPMTIQNSDGHSVTYVVQDRGSQYDVKEEQKEALAAILGPDAVDPLLYDETTFSFSRVLLMDDRVMSVIDDALTAAKKKLVKTGVITEEQGDELIVAKTKVSFRPNTLDRLAEICGRDTVKMDEFLDAAGSSFTRYVKV